MFKTETAVKKDNVEKSFASYGTRVPRKDENYHSGDFNKQSKYDSKKISFTLYSQKSGKYDSLKK